MARPRKRVCLEDGLKLDLNQLIRDGIVVSGALTSRTIFWQVAGSRETVGVAVITADLTVCPRIRVRMRGLDQTIDLIPQRRHLGGQQWYFRCPALNRRVSVLKASRGKSKLLRLVCDTAALRFMSSMAFANLPAIACCSPFVRD